MWRKKTSERTEGRTSKRARQLSATSFRTELFSVFKALSKNRLSHSFLYIEDVKNFAIFFYVSTYRRLRNVSAMNQKAKKNFFHPLHLYFLLVFFLGGSTHPRLPFCAKPCWRKIFHKRIWRDKSTIVFARGQRGEFVKPDTLNPLLKK